MQFLKIYLTSALLLHAACRLPVSVILIPVLSVPVSVSASILSVSVSTSLVTIPLHPVRSSTLLRRHVPSSHLLDLLHGLLLLGRLKSYFSYGKSQIA